MRTLLDVFLLGVGFVLLIQSAKVFVDASVNIAKRLRIPTVVIGLTVVAMGTSAPEVAISVSAALGGSSDLAIANSVGSNLFNLLFIVGLAALIYPIGVNIKEIARDYWVSLAATILLLIMVVFFNHHIPRLAGFAFLVLFAVYLTTLVRYAIKNKCPKEQAQQTDVGKQAPLWRSILLAILGVGVIIAAGQLTVFSAVNLALTMGITERVVGLTIVSIGTSLPELVTTLVACRKKEGEFALGFIIGSSIFNIMFVLGLAGTITPLVVENSVIFDTAALTIGTLAFFLFAKTGKQVSRIEGLAMTLMYMGYMVWVIVN